MHNTNFSNIYILTQLHILSNITHPIHKYSNKFSSNLNPLIPEPAFVCHLFLFKIVLKAERTQFLTKPINFSPLLQFNEYATHFVYRVSIDTKGPVSPSLQGNS